MVYPPSYLDLFYGFLKLLSLVCICIVDKVGVKLSPRSYGFLCSIFASESSVIYLRFASVLGMCFGLVHLMFLILALKWLG